MRLARACVLATSATLSVALASGCPLALAGASGGHAAAHATLQEPPSTETEALASRLRSGDAEARRDAAMRLTASRDPAAARLLVGALDDQVEVVRATVAGSLGELRAREAVAPLLELLAKEKRPFVRKTIAFALGEIGDQAAVLPLAGRLTREKDKEARAAAVTALGQIGDRSAVPALVDRLRDKEAFVRREAVRALGNLGDPSVVPALVDRLSNDSDADVRRHAATALGQLRDPRAKAALEAAQHDKDPYVADEALRILRSGLLGGA